MAYVHGQPVTNLRGGTLRVRLARVSAAPLVALTATEVALAIGHGVLHLTPAPAALASWFPGGLASYALSRWVRNRAGRPDLVNETIPFWAISALLIAFLAIAARIGYHSAASLHLTGVANVLWVNLIWLPASLGAFRLQFAIFHLVLFADRPAPPRANPRHPAPPAHHIRKTLSNR